MDGNNSRDISPLDSTRWIWITRRARIAGHGPIVRAVFHVLRARRCASMQRWGIILVTENTTDCPPKGSEFWKGNPGWDLRKFQENPKVGEIYLIIWPESCQPCQGLKSTEPTSRIRTRDYQDQDLYHSERAFRGFSLGPTIGVTLGSWDKAHLSNKIKVA